MDSFTPAKRLHSDYPQPTSGIALTGRVPPLDPELRDQLATIGMRARKAVSEGHQTQGSLPSYRGDVVGPLDREGIAKQFEFEDLRPKSELARRLESTGSTKSRSAKRSRDDMDVAEADDPYGTDVDEPLPEKPTMMNGVQAFFVPTAYRSQSQSDADFAEADFLQPRESFN